MKPPPGKVHVFMTTNNRGKGVIFMVAKKATTPTSTMLTDQKNQCNSGISSLISIGKDVAKVIADLLRSEVGGTSN